MTQKTKNQLQAKTIPTILGSLLLLATIIGWQWTTRYIEERKNLIFEQTTADVENKINQHLELYLNSIYGFRALMENYPNTNRAAFRNYFNTVDLSDHFPAISGINFVRTVDSADLDSFTEFVKNDTSVQAEGYPYFKIKSPSTLDKHYIITYIEPSADLKTSEAFGFDVGSDPARFNAIQKATETHQAQTTDPLTTFGKPAKGFLIFMPVYNSPNTTAGVPFGYLGGIFQSESFFKTVYEDEHNVTDIDYAVFSGNKTSNQNLIYSEDPSYTSSRQINAKFQKTVTLNVPGKIWTIYFYADDISGISKAEKLLPIVTLSGGILFTILIFSIIYSYGASKITAQKIASEITKDLAEKENYLRGVIDNLPVAVFSKDPENGLKFKIWNKMSQKIFGFSQEEVLGKTDYDLFPKAQADFFIQTDKKVLSEGKVFDIAEEEANSKELGVITLHTTKVPLIDRAGKAFALLAISENITERIKSEAALKQKTAELERLNGMMVGRELRMIELKDEINRLKRSGGEHAG